MDEIERFKHAGRTVVLCLDPEPLNPRKEYDNLCTLACWHRRGMLGDKQIDGMSAKELVRELRDRGEKVLALLPLYIYEHGGVTMNAGAGFSDPWDSGQVGWGYVTQAQAEHMGCVGTYTDPTTGQTKRYDRAFFEAAIRQEVATYDEYLTGQVYGFQVLGQDGDHLDSCWGFFGGLAYCREEAKGAAEHTVDPAVERIAQELQQRATFAAC